LRLAGSLAVLALLATGWQWFKRAAKEEIPLGYQDETGFHCQK
jgi:hypothetical protein